MLATKESEAEMTMELSIYGLTAVTELHIATDDKTRRNQPTTQLIQSSKDKIKVWGVPTQHLDNFIAYAFRCSVII